MNEFAKTAGQTAATYCAVNADRNANRRAALQPTQQTVTDKARRTGAVSGIGGGRTTVSLLGYRELPGHGGLTRSVPVIVVTHNGAIGCYAAPGVNGETPATRDRENHHLQRCPADIYRLAGTGVTCGVNAR